MKISPVNVSFQGKVSKNANDKKEGRKRYFEYLSKANANEALKMSKGREETDGKFRLAQFVTGSAAVVSAFAGIMSGLSAKSIFDKTLSASLDFKPKPGYTPEKVAKSIRRGKASIVLAGVTTLLACAALEIGNANKRSADKTANKRSFNTFDQIYHDNKKPAEVYSTTEKTYSEHVK